MRVFGILLIIFNLLAGAGFVYLATVDWKGRQTINAAGVRSILILQGLPLEAPQGAPEGFDPNDKTPFVVEMGGGESTKTISKKLLESYFQANTAAAPAAPGTEPPAPAPKINLASRDAVTNQIAEVKRVQGVINAELDKDASSAEKLALLKSLLLNQAEDYATRAEYLSLSSLNDDVGQPKSAEKLKDDADKLRKHLDARFKAVIDKPQVSDSPAIDAALSDKDKITKSVEWRAALSQDTSDRRVRVAHLLVHLDTDATWQKRVVTIVGMRRYVKAITLQTLRFVDMISHVERFIPEDQAAYAKLESQLREKATQNAERAKAVGEIRAALVEQKTAQDDAVNRRRTALKEITDQLNKIKAEVDELLVKQTGIEKLLYEIQREVGSTLEEVYRLEALLANVERERYGIPPKP